MFVIFTTVLLDLVGFGIIIPLVGLYGRHFGASGWELGVLGAAYSLAQFVFAPFWGALSDRLGRRPILLTSLLGSTLSYVGFALAPSFWLLVATRVFAGVFAANISAAQAYLADITPPQDRAKAMGLIGAAFGIGFTLGPPLGGISSVKWGLSAPGWIAASICGANFLLALVRLPESLAPQFRKSLSWKSYLPFSAQRLQMVRKTPHLAVWIAAAFFTVFAFSCMEQTFSLLFLTKFGFSTAEAGYRTGLILMFAGLLGAALQGGAIRRLAPRFGERRLLLVGLIFQALGMLAFPWGPDYISYYGLVVPIAVGSSLINPSVSALISRSVGPSDQGAVFGLQQGMGSLARAAGPFCGLLIFQVWPAAPFLLAALVTAGVMLGFVLFAKSANPG